MTNSKRQCSFCETVDPEFVGEAHTYVRWPADVDRENGVHEFPVCSQCALSQQDNENLAAEQFRPGDRDYLGTCDVCGAVGCTSSARRGWGGEPPTGAVADDTYRVRTVIGWSVEIAGYDGGTSTCIACSPIAPVDCVRRPNRGYDDKATILVEPPFKQEQQVEAGSAPGESRQAGLTAFAGDR